MLVSVGPLRFDCRYNSSTNFMKITQYLPVLSSLQSVLTQWKPRLSSKYRCRSNSVPKSCGNQVVDPEVGRRAVWHSQDYCLSACSMKVRYTKFGTTLVRLWGSNVYLSIILTVLADFPYFVHIYVLDHFFKTFHEC